MAIEDSVLLCPGTVIQMPAPALSIASSWAVSRAPQRNAVGIFVSIPVDRQIEYTHTVLLLRERIQLIDLCIQGRRWVHTTRIQALRGSVAGKTAKWFRRRDTRERQALVGRVGIEPTTN